MLKRVRESVVVFSVDGWAWYNVGERQLDVLIIQHGTNIANSDVAGSQRMQGTVKLQSGAGWESVERDESNAEKKNS